MKFSTVSRIAAACALAAASVPALAAGTWDFSVCNGSTTSAGTSAGSQTGAGAVGNAYACAASGSTTRDLTVSAWGAVSNTNNTFGAAWLSSQGTDGFGVGAGSEGGAGTLGNTQALDNDPTGLVPNLILLKFNSAVILDKVTLGWSMNDADLTIMAYTGSALPSSFLSGKTATNLTTGGASAGWSLVQNVGDVAPDTAYAASGTDIVRSVNAGGVASSYWLISSYSSSFGAGAMDTLVDYAKLLGVTTRDATSSKVPEPGSLALAASALLLLWSRRRHQASRRV